jgi:3-oxoacyl-[acyl-carrier-protein] synthase I
MKRLVVKATGMVTCVGFNSPSSCAAIRGRISGVSESHLWDATAGVPVRAGKVRLLQWWDGVGKLAEMVAPAIQECLVAASPIGAADIPILLGVADEERPHRYVDLDAELLGEVERRLDLSHHANSRLIPKDRVSGVIGLMEAKRLIEGGKAPACIVAGVDSYLSQLVVEVYLDRRRLVSEGNSNGFFPGEAGCAVLVGPSSQGRADELEILGFGLAQETGTIDSDKPLRAEGMTKAVRAALADAKLPMHDTQYRITDLNGEHYKFKEGVFTVGRLMKKKTIDLYDVWHPIEFLGDIGAAIVPCVLAVALHAGQKRYAPGSRAVCHFGSDNGERAAVITQFQSRKVS